MILGSPSSHLTRLEELMIHAPGSQESMDIVRPSTGGLRTMNSNGKLMAFFHSRVLGIYGHGDRTQIPLHRLTEHLLR